MAEMGLNQKGLSELLGVSTSRVSEFLNGKSEPPLKIARDISRKLNIDSAIILGFNFPGQERLKYSFFNFEPLHRSNQNTHVISITCVSRNRK